MDHRATGRGCGGDRDRFSGDRLVGVGVGIAEAGQALNEAWRDDDLLTFRETHRRFRDAPDAVVNPPPTRRYLISLIWTSGTIEV